MLGNGHLVALEAVGRAGSGTERKRAYAGLARRTGKLLRQGKHPLDLDHSPRSRESQFWDPISSNKCRWVTLWKR